MSVTKPDDMTDERFKHIVQLLVNFVINIYLPRLKRHRKTT